MASQNCASSSFKVYARWRPLIQNDLSTSEIERAVIRHESKHSISISSYKIGERSHKWESAASFVQVFQESALNNQVFKAVVEPTMGRVLEGGTCNFFAYGHSGSGKTHTILGYNYDDDEHLGLCLSTGRDLFHAIGEINGNLTSNSSDNSDVQGDFGIAVRLFEVRGKCAYDLFNNSAECHVREGPDGRTHIRGQTETLKGGKVRVRPIVAMSCWSFEQLRRTILAGLELRKTGSSSVHDESSRTHAVLELEVIDKALLDARDAVIERESELVPVGKEATDVYLEEHMRALIRTPEGQYVSNPEYPLNQQRIDLAESRKRECEARLKMAEDAVAKCLGACRHPCLGGKFVFVDLAGSEYLDQSKGNPKLEPKQTPQERQQARQINADLFALKEVIRARALNQARIPFRSSPLTMILRSHFLATKVGESAMILTTSPSETQYAATLNTLKYGNLVGVASENRCA